MITHTNDFYRTGMDGDVLGFDYYNKMSGKMEHGATYNTGNVSQIIKRDSIKIIYMKEYDYYRSKYYDQVIKEMKPWHIILQALFYIVLVVSVVVPLRMMDVLLNFKKIKMENGR